MCLSPIYLHKKDKVSGKIVETVVPCGVCPECLKKRQSAVVVRTLQESIGSKSMYMFTLTYSDDKVPSCESGEMSLCREDIKNWKKDFRRFLDGNKVSWLCCGEYGPSTNRPHYHGLIFNITPLQKVKIEECWKGKYGFTVFKRVPLLGDDHVGRVARYVAKYIVKDDDFKVPSSFVERPRLMTSVGFGYRSDSAFWDFILCKDKHDYNPFDASTLTYRIVSDVIDRMHYDYHGFHYSIPDYYLRKYLYEKNFKGNLEKCPLLKMVSSVKRIRNQMLCDSEFKQFVDANSQMLASEIVAEFQARKDLYTDEKRNSQRENIISTYKKSVI